MPFEIDETSPCILIALKHAAVPKSPYLVQNGPLSLFILLGQPFSVTIAMAKVK